jgi:hypothetical protein
MNTSLLLLLLWWWFVSPSHEITTNNNPFEPFNIVCAWKRGSEMNVPLIHPTQNREIVCNPEVMIFSSLDFGISFKDPKVV